jgi:hypothetical protein
LPAVEDTSDIFGMEDGIGELGKNWSGYTISTLGGIVGNPGVVIRGEEVLVL